MSEAIRADEGRRVRYEGMSLADLELWQATHQGSSEAAREALAAGANPSSVSERGEGLLARAARVLGEGSGSRRVSCLLTLLEAGADPNSADSRGRSALLLAAKAGSLRAIQALLAFKADPNKACDEGGSALHWAAVSEDGRLAEELLAAGAAPDAKNRFGETPAGMAARNGAALALAALLRAGADPRLALSDGKISRVCAGLLEAALERQELEEQAAPAPAGGKPNGL